MFQLNVSTLASYPVAAAAVLVCAGVLSLKVYQAPEKANLATVAMQQPATAVSAAGNASWSLSTSPINARSLGATPIRTANDNMQNHRLAAPPRYVLDSTPVSYEPASFKF